MPGQLVVAARRETDAELRGARPVEAALPQESPTGARVDARHVGQHLAIELLRHPMRVEQSLTTARADVVASARPTVLVAQFHAELAGQSLDGLGEGQVLGLLDEGDDVAALTASEAVIGAQRWPDVEARRLLVVEGTQALEGPDPGRAQGHVLADDVLDRAALLDRGHVLGVDPTRH
jgi:hypothetical protein